MILSLVASLSVPLPEQIDDDDLVDIQWMPPGKHEVTPSEANTGKPKSVTVIVDEDGAKRVSADCEKYLAEAMEGKGDAPYLDFNHDDKDASGWVQAAYWGGDDPKTGGIRLKIKPSDLGKESISGKRYRRFSPGFYVDKQDDGIYRVAGAPVNMGGFVNKAAFRTIQPLFAKDLTEANLTQEEHNTMSEDEIKALQDKCSALEKENSELKSQLDTITAKQAECAVNDAVKNGQLDPNDKELQAKWTKLVKQNPDNMYLLAKLPGKAVPGQVYSPKDNKDEPDEGKVLLAKYNDISDPTKRYEFFSEHQEKLCKAAIQ